MKSAKRTRAWIGRKCMTSAGININIERGVCFPQDLKIDSNSALGVNRRIQNSGVSMGNNVLMGPGVMIFTTNHEISRTGIPICMQGNAKPKPVIIEDDIWTGARVMIMPGVVVKRRCAVWGIVLTKTFPEYLVIVGNPGRVVMCRKD